MRSEVLPISLSLFVVYMSLSSLLPLSNFFVNAGVKQLFSWCLTDFIAKTSFDLDQLIRCRRLLHFRPSLTYNICLYFLFLDPLLCLCLKTLRISLSRVILANTYSLLERCLLVDFQTIFILLFSCLNKFSSVIAEVKEFFRLWLLQNPCNSQ